jgi:hypothetical protein
MVRTGELTIPRPAQTAGENNERIHAGDVMRDGYWCGRKELADVVLAVNLFNVCHDSQLYIFTDVS